MSEPEILGFSHTQGLDPQVSSSVWPTLRKQGSGMAVWIKGIGLRRLEPRECERLQGFPDDWTLHDATGKVLTDTFRYETMGNAVAVPVAEWIGRRILGTS